jgi:hypothetical protein
VSLGFPRAPWAVKMPVRPPESRRIDFSSGYQYYTFWSPATAAIGRGHIERARCSWCLAEAKHLLLEHHKVRRNVYECGACARRTVPCRKKGCTAMCKGGLWDNERCTLCAKEIKAWPLTAVERSEQRLAVEREVMAARKRAEAELRKRPAMLRVGINPDDFHRHGRSTGHLVPSSSSSDGSGADDVFGSGTSSSSEDEDAVVAPPPPVEVSFTEQGRLGISFHRNSMPPLAIAKIAPQTLAAAQSSLRAGMALVKLQGVPTAGMPYDEVLSRLRQAGRPLALVFEHTWLSGGGV